MSTNNKKIKKRYRYTFTHNGQRYEVVSRKSDSDAIRKLKQKKLEVIANESTSLSGHIKVYDWGMRCIQSFRPNQSTRTKKQCQYMYKHYICEKIGDCYLDEIKPMHIHELLNTLSDYSDYTIAKVYELLKFVFKCAVDNDLISSNPVEKITQRPTGKKYECRRAMTRDEESSFLRVVGKHKHALYWMFMYACGCRPTEAANIKRSDIVNKDKKYYFDNPDGSPFLHIRGTKSKSADRYVPIPNSVMQYIPSTGLQEDFLCLTESGKIFNDRSRRRAWKSLINLMNIDLGCNVYRNHVMPPFKVGCDLVPYCLRHTYATNLFRKNLDIRLAKQVLGHSTPELLMKVYTHPDIEDLVHERDKFE